MRVYLDHNATTALRPEARAAMGEAMDIVGNPSSVHSEGRRAKAFLESCRARLAAALGAEGAEIVFTGSATEAAAMALAGRGRPWRLLVAALPVRVWSMMLLRLGVTRRCAPRPTGV